MSAWWLSIVERALLILAVTVGIGGAAFVAGAEYTRLHTTIQDLKVANEILKTGNAARAAAAAGARIDVLRNDGFQRGIIGAGCM